ncbi:MAG: polysaccharide pyruvyl transferase family protein, partial [Exilibacterium sp.]
MIRVLHVASFSGNIGDCANHLGLRSQLEKIGDFEYTDLEIRHSYQNYIGPCRWEWDQSFVDRCNQYDMVIIGGGNYFEPRWETPNGTTAGINSDDLAKIKVPVVFFGVGFDCYKGVNPSSIRRFSRFIGRASRMKHVLMSCRNDGSLKQLKEQLPIADLPIQVVPDGGFFCSTEMQSGTFHQLMEGKKYWAVNVSCDLINLGLSGIAENLAKRLTQSDHYVLFIPHITSDLRAISQILD